MYVEPMPSANPPAFNSANASNFSVGAVLSRSFSTLLKHPFVFMGLSFLAQIPMLVTILLMINFVWGIWTALMIGATLSMFMLVLIQGAIFLGVYEVLQGNAARFGKSLLDMIRILPTILSAFLTFTFFVMMMVPSLLLNEEPILVNTAVQILANAMMVIAIWLILRCCVIIPVFVAERLGPIRAIKRAAELTKGCLLKITCLYLLFGIVVTIFNRGVAFTLMFFMDELDTFVLGAFLRGIPQTLFYIMTAVIYFELRSVKEGVRVDGLADVFD